MTLSLSTIVIGLVSALAYLLKVLVRRGVNDRQWQVLLKDAITVAEMSGCCFELGVVYENYGIGMYALYLFLLSIYQTVAWGDTYACAYLHVEDWYQRRSPPRTVALRVLAEVVGGWVAWRYVRLLWWLELSPAHQDRWLDACTADLQVSPLLGALVEGGGVLTHRLLVRTMEDLEPKFAVVVDSLASTALVIAGFNYSGGFYNPVLASAINLGCAGHTVTEHLLVYWAGATAGAVASVSLYPRLRPLLTGGRYKRE